MSNDYFNFRRFIVRQSRCAMKVGTDATLLGAWAHGGTRILDIGTGTGLIALMMAQRFPGAYVVGVDIDAEACLQAKENVEASPFDVTIVHADVTKWKLHTEMTKVETYDAIVSNPPFFDRSLECPDGQRTTARHTSSLGYRDLMLTVKRLLADDGEFSLVIPVESKSQMDSEAAICGFFKVRECAVRTTLRKMPKRYLLAFRKHPAEFIEVSEGVIEDTPGQRSPWYSQLTNEFYL